MRVCTLLDIIYTSNKENSRISYKEFYNATANNDEKYRKVRITTKYRNKLRNGIQIV